MRILTAILITAAIGVLAGWLLRDRLTQPRVVDRPASPLVPVIKVDGASTVTGLDVVRESRGNPSYLAPFLDGSQASIDILKTYFSIHGGDFGLYMSGVETLQGLGDLPLALEWINAADLLSETPDERRKVSQLLADVSDAHARALTERRQFNALVRLYEDITLVMPERAEYFLKLAEARVQSGDPNGALMPLAQIQNYSGSLGEQARKLIENIEQGGATSVAGRSLPLRRSGNQFVVRATVDGRRTVNLLIDTGAALTILDRSVLLEMGYHLSNKPTRLFSTAGGPVEAPIVDLVALAVGLDSSRSLTVGVLPMELPSGVDGLLGMNFLRQFDFRIDQDRALLLLEKRVTR